MSSGREEPACIPVAQAETFGEEPDGILPGPGDAAGLELTDGANAQPGPLGQFLLGKPRLDPQVEQEIGKTAPSLSPAIRVRQSPSPLQSLTRPRTT